LNGYPVIRFDGVNDFLDVEFGETFTPPMTIFIVWNYINTSTDFKMLIGNTTGSGHSNNSIWTTINRISTNSPSGYDKNIPFNHIVTVAEYNSTNSKIFENGILKVTKSLTDVNQSNFRVGAWEPTGQYARNSEIPEIIFYDALLTDTQRISVENYLMSKYNL